MAGTPVSYCTVVRRESEDHVLPLGFRKVCSCTGKLPEPPGWARWQVSTEESIGGTVCHRPSGCNGESNQFSQFVIYPSHQSQSCVKFFSYEDEDSAPSSFPYKAALIIMASNLAGKSQKPMLKTLKSALQAWTLESE